MLSCQEISRLVSESLDRKLPWHRRMEVWLHLKMCRLCSGFWGNLLRIRTAARESAAADEPLPDGPDRLSSESKDRMRRLISKELSDGTGN